jgi:hypothetical protein
MKILVTRTVPGLVDYRTLVAGEEYSVPDVTAVSLIGDGYAEPVRETAAEVRETRAPGPGRPRKRG